MIVESRPDSSGLRLADFADRCAAAWVQRT